MVFLRLQKIKKEDFENYIKPPLLTAKPVLYVILTKMKLNYLKQFIEINRFT